jgi:hypothetical protein
MLRVYVAFALCLFLAAGPAWTDTAEVAATNANLRSTPGTSSPVVATLVRGARLDVLDVSGDWLKVRVVETKAVGWVHRRLVGMLPATGSAPPASALPKPPAPVAVAASAAGAPLSIEHRDVGCIVAGHYPKLEACFNPDASVGRGRVLFRAAGSDPWYYVDMGRDGSCYSAVLPKPKPELKGFEYFVDVIDKAFAESHKPEGAPARAFTPRVVKKQDDCDPARKMALFLPRLANPIVVGIARSPAGSVLSAVAAKALESHALLTGFSSEGVIVSSTGAAPAAASGSSNFTQSGNAVGGNMTYSGRTFTCTSPDPQLQQILNNALIPGDSGGFPLSGTATDTSVTLTISTITFTGTHSRTTMDLNGNLGSNLGLPYTMTLKLVRQ